MTPAMACRVKETTKALLDLYFDSILKNSQIVWFISSPVHWFINEPYCKCDISDLRVELPHGHFLRIALTPEDNTPLTNYP